MTLIGETVLYYHHNRPGVKPRAGLVTDENDDGSVTVAVFLPKSGKTFPAFWLRETPTGKTGHYFKRRNATAPSLPPYVPPELICFVTPCEGCGRLGVTGKDEGQPCAKCGCGSPNEIGSAETGNDDGEERSSISNPNKTDIDDF